MDFEKSSKNEDPNENAEELDLSEEKPDFLKEKNEDLDLDSLEKKLDFLKERKQKIIKEGGFTPKELENNETSDSVDNALLNIRQEIEEIKERIEEIYHKENAKKKEDARESDWTDV